MFRYLLMLSDDEPNDPLAFLTPVPNYSVGETIMLGEGDQLRILRIQTEIGIELAARGFNRVFTVERVASKRSGQEN